MTSNKMKMKQKIALLFAALLILTVLPISAWAADDSIAEETSEENGPLLNIYQNIYSVTELESGLFYHCVRYAFYIPHHIDESTKSVIYYPGGCGEPALMTSYALDYVSNYAPNAIAVFMTASGYLDLPKKTEESWQVLETICREKGTEIRGLVLAGSSNGGYTALKAIPYLYEHHGIKAESLLVFDMGMNFLVAHLLPSKEECRTISKLGTEIYFFDQRCIDRNNPQLNLLESFGLRYHLIYCTLDEHIQITRDGFTEGTISWALGEKEDLSQDYYELA